jgi:hypothetical protein
MKRMAEPAPMQQLCCLWTDCASLVECAGDRRLQTIGNGLKPALFLDQFGSDVSGHDFSFRNALANAISEAVVATDTTDFPTQ